jgi:hypothetical protein
VRKEGDTSRRVKDLAGAFAQLPHLPKMLKSDAILDTLVAGCEQGTFVLRLARPDQTFRTWWRCRPDETSLDDAALELVLPEAAELAEIAASLLPPGKLPELWSADEISVQTVFDYFSGSRVVHVDHGGYQEPVPVPRAGQEAVEKAIAATVESGAVWMLSGPASVLGEPIPAGILTPMATLCPPPPIGAAEILPENLPLAWQGEETSALAVATGLSQKAGKTLPWKTVRDAITSSLQARFTEPADTSAAWPCEFHGAKSVRIKVAEAKPEEGGGGFGGGKPSPKKLAAMAALEPSEIQDLADVMPKLLDIKAKSKVPIAFTVRIELGDGQELPGSTVVEQINQLLKDVKDDFQVH